LFLGDLQFKLGAGRSASIQCVNIRSASLQ
jgi:hypothetical protein